MCDIWFLDFSSEKWWERKILQSGFLFPGFYTNGLASSTRNITRLCGHSKKKATAFWMSSDFIFFLDGLWLFWFLWFQQMIFPWCLFFKFYNHKPCIHSQRSRIYVHFPVGSSLIKCRPISWDKQWSTQPTVILRLQSFLVVCCLWFNADRAVELK